MHTMKVRGKKRATFLGAWTYPLHGVKVMVIRWALRYIKMWEPKQIIISSGICGLDHYDVLRRVIIVVTCIASCH
jgi:hypothetical protein